MTPTEARRTLALLHATAIQRATTPACEGWRAVAVSARTLADLCGLDLAGVTDGGTTPWNRTPTGDDAAAAETCRTWLSHVARYARALYRSHALRESLVVSLEAMAEQGLDVVAPQRRAA